MCDEDYYNLTDLLHDQFKDLVSRRSSSPRSAVRSTREVTGLLLTKIRTGMYHSILATVFGLTEIRVSQIVASARNSLYSGFCTFVSRVP